MPPKPTDAELAILNLLWDRGPSTVRELHEQQESRDVGYTTTLKQLQVMHEKGLVDRDASSRSHVYQAAVSQETTQTALLEHLLDSTFGGSVTSLMMRALDRQRSTPTELAEIRSLLEDLPDG